ncbi:hypothetical protein M758_UG085200 [Ceratodon purpureus]|nr:hypothetical protein M758_UG085200 [Ceratodon purpureus]
MSSPMWRFTSSRADTRSSPTPTPWETSSSPTPTLWETKSSPNPTLWETRSSPTPAPWETRSSPATTTLVSKVFLRISLNTLFARVRSASARGGSLLAKVASAWAMVSTASGAGGWFRARRLLLRFGAADVSASSRSRRFFMPGDGV